MKTNSRQEKLLKRMNNPLFFRLFTRKMVPAAAHAGVRFGTLDESKCVIEVPYKRRNKNPFRSMYFAVQSMAAEMSTALPIMFFLAGQDVSVAWIVVDFDATFPAKATGDVTFTCEQVEEIKSAVVQAARSDEPVQLKLKTVGCLKDGKEVSSFTFHWSLKRRA